MLRVIPGLLERLLQLGDLLAEARDDIDKLRKMVSDLEALDPDGRSWPGHTGAAEFFEELVTYRELDGLQWSWHQFRYSTGGTALMRYFNVLPPSELPIPDYDDDEDED